jgi:hypothetical protein
VRSPPEFYEEFNKDCCPPGGKKMSFSQLLKKQILTALICGRAWTRIDLPFLLDEETGEPRRYDSQASQQQDGALDAYAVITEPESVLDWEVDESGELIWALIGVICKKRESLADDRDWITRKFLLLDRASWAKYEIRHKEKEEPKPEDQVTMVASGSHSFDRVPLLRFEVPEGLWAMEKLESLARAHFNEVNALDWAVIQSLFQELYEFEGPEVGTPGMQISEAQEDEERAWVQPRGQGFVQTRGHQDRAEFIGPDTSPFDFALKHEQSKRSEMHRVTHQMALALDNSAAALGRSADSKAHDKAATAVILQALGKIVREHAEDIYNCVSAGRGEKTLVGQWNAQGMEKFDAVHVTDALENALVVDQLEIESPTFRKRHRFAICKLTLGDDATPEDLEDIEMELEENITSEPEAPVAAPALAVVAGGKDEQQQPGQPGVPPVPPVPPQQQPPGTVQPAPGMRGRK